MQLPIASTAASRARALVFARQLAVDLADGAARWRCRRRRCDAGIGHRDEEVAGIGKPPAISMLPPGGVNFTALVKG